MTIQFKHTTLDNGLTIIGEHVPAAHSAAVGFFVKAGARDEATRLMGVSHFLEHMMFKGTETRTAEDVDRGFDDLGAEHNAFTTSELTAFYCHTLPEQIAAGEEILSDIMRPSIRTEDFDAEKKVILEEIAMYDDQPFWVLYEQTMEAYYQGHPLAHRVLGTIESITNLSRDEMASYFQHRYSADNTVVAIAGAFDFDAMVERLRDHCGHWKRTDALRDHPHFTPAQATIDLPSETVNRHYSLMVMPAPSIQDDLRYAAGVLMQVLGNVDGSRFYWSLIETGLAEEAQAMFDGRDGIGEYILFTSCSVENAEEVEAIMQRELADVLDSVTDDDLERVRNRIATAATLRGELPGGRMRRLGQQWLYQGQYRSLEDELAHIETVTRDDLRKVAALYPLEPKVLGRLHPAK